MQAKSTRRTSMIGAGLLATLMLVLIGGGGPPAEVAHCGATSSGGVVMGNGTAMIVGQAVVGVASSADYSVRFGVIHCLNAIATVPPSCPEDFDGDGDIDAADLAELLASWGPCLGCPADFDNDGDVDSADLAELLSAWGQCV